jgi:hypothetical protein
MLRKIILLILRVSDARHYHQKNPYQYRAQSFLHLEHLLSFFNERNPKSNTPRHASPSVAPSPLRAAKASAARRAASRARRFDARFKSFKSLVCREFRRPLSDRDVSERDKGNAADR